MSRARWIPWITAAVLGLVATTAALGLEPTPLAAAPPKGLRILYSGDSWHRFMPGLMDRIGAAAGIADQKVSSRRSSMRGILTSSAGAGPRGRAAACRSFSRQGSSRRA
jgi:hypothetical protein